MDVKNRKLFDAAIARGDMPTHRRHGHTCPECGNRWWHDPDACRGDDATYESCEDAHVCSKCGAVQREVDMSICDKDPEHVPQSCALADPPLGFAPLAWSNPDKPLHVESQSGLWAALEAAHGAGGWSMIDACEVARGDGRMARVECALAGGEKSITYVALPKSDPPLGAIGVSVGDGFSAGFGAGLGYDLAQLAVGAAVLGIGAGGLLLLSRLDKKSPQKKDRPMVQDAKVGAVPVGPPPAGYGGFDPFNRVEINVAGYRVKMTGDLLRKGGAPVPMNFDDSVAAAVALGAIPPTRALGAAALAAAKVAGTAVVMPQIQSPDPSNPGAHPVGTALGDKQVALFSAAYPAALPPDSTIVRYGGHKDMILDPSGQPNPKTGHSELRESGAGSMVLDGGLQANGTTLQKGKKSDHGKEWRDYSQPQQFFFRDAIGPDGQPVDLLAVVAAGGPLGGPLPAWLAARLGGAGGGAAGGPAAGLWG